MSLFAVLDSVHSSEKVLMSRGPERPGELESQKPKEGCHQHLVNETVDPCFIYYVQ